MYTGGRQPGAKDLRPRRTSSWTTERRIAAGSELRRCPVCDTEFWVSRAQREKVTGGGTYCSNACKYKMAPVRCGRPRGPDVVRHSAGYLLEWAPEHPRQSRGRVLQHLLVMEAVLGRALVRGEEVHHVNGHRDDNRPDNLQVWQAGEHQRLHATLPGVRERMRQDGRRLIAARARDSNGRLIPDKEDPP